MKKKTRMLTVAAFAAMVMAITWPAVAQETTKPKYSADVPEFLLTPEKVETEFLGTLEFFDGMPSETTVKKAYDFLDLLRGVETFLNGMPAAFLYAMLEGLKDAGRP